MHGLWRLTVMQFKLYLREPVAFFFSLAYPALLLPSSGKWIKSTKNLSENS